jgi:hypothetical protein
LYNPAKTRAILGSMYKNRIRESGGWAKLQTIGDSALQ